MNQGQGFFESDDDYRDRVAEEANEQTIENSTGSAPSQGFLESDDNYRIRIAKEANELRIESATGASPSKGFFEIDESYRNRIEREANESTIASLTGEKPSQGFFENNADYVVRVRKEANEQVVARSTRLPRAQGFFEGDHAYRSRIAHEAREVMANGQSMLSVTGDSGTFPEYRGIGSDLPISGSTPPVSSRGYFVVILIIASIIFLFLNYAQHEDYRVTPSQVVGAVNNGAVPMVKQQSDRQGFPETKKIEVISKLLPIQQEQQTELKPTPAPSLQPHSTVKTNGPTDEKLGNSVGMIESVNTEWNFVVIHLNDARIVTTSSILYAINDSGQKQELNVKRISGNTVSALPKSENLMWFTSGMRVYIRGYRVTPSQVVGAVNNGAVPMVKQQSDRRGFPAKKEIEVISKLPPIQQEQQTELKPTPAPSLQPHSTVKINGPTDEKLGNSVGMVESVNTEWNFVVIHLNDTNTVTTSSTLYAINSSGQKQALSVKRITGNIASALPKIGNLQWFSSGMRVYRGMENK